MFSCFQHSLASPTFRIKLQLIYPLLSCEKGTMWLVQRTRCKDKTWEGNITKVGCHVAGVVSSPRSISTRSILSELLWYFKLLNIITDKSKTDWYPSAPEENNKSRTRREYATVRACEPTLNHLLIRGWVFFYFWKRTVSTCRLLALQS
jgi:hypothetical protein